MTSQEFVLWLKGFTDALPPDGPATLKQWTTLKDKLAEVNDEPTGVPIGEGGFGIPNTQPFPRWQEPHTYYPNVEIPCINPNGTVPSPGFVVTTTPGTTITTTPGGSISTIITPNGMSTSTTYGYPSGSAWSYTNGEK
jgi:hypothetical protein